MLGGALLLQSYMSLAKQDQWLVGCLLSLQLPACKLMGCHRNAAISMLCQGTSLNARAGLGGQYIDYVGSWGPAIVGHAHPEVSEALKEQIYKARLDMLFFVISSAVIAPLRTGVMLICFYCTASPIICVCLVHVYFLCTCSPPEV